MSPSGRGASRSATTSLRAFATGNRGVPSRWHLDGMYVDVGGVKHWLWRAALEHGTVLEVFLQKHCDTEAAKSFSHRLLREYDVPEVTYTDKL